MSTSRVNRTTTGSRALADVVVGLLADRGFDAERVEANGQLVVRFEDGSYASVQCQMYMPLAQPAAQMGLAAPIAQRTITPAGLT